MNISDYYIFHVDQRRYIFHGPSCLIFDISAKEYDCLERNTNDEDTLDAYDNLEKSAAVYSKHVKQGKNEAIFKPNLLVLNISGKCNLQCKYCFSQDRKGFKFKSMTEQECLDAVSFLINSNPGEEHFIISFFGGEPLLEKEILMRVVPAILNEYVGKKFSFSITTNGSILTDDILSFIKQYSISLLVSFDGIKEIVKKYRPHKSPNVDTYSIVYSNIERLKKEKVNFSLRATIVASNGQLMETIQFFEKLQVPYYLVPCFNPGNDNSDEFSDWNDNVLVSFSKEYDDAVFYFLQKLHDNGKIYCFSFISKLKAIATQSVNVASCGVGITLFSVTDRGKIFPCMNFAIHPETSIGDIYSGIDERLRKKYQPFYIDQGDECKDCLIRHQCCGGCLSGRYNAESKMINPPDKNMCNLSVMMWKKAIEAFQSLKNRSPHILDALPETIDIE